MRATKHEVIELLARTACIADGDDPNVFPPDHAPMGPYHSNSLPWYAPDGKPRPWHRYIKEAEQFVRFKLMEEIYNSTY